MNFFGETSTGYSVAVCSEQTNVPTTEKSCFEVFLAFLALGSTAFGGPIAHLGYFRREFVERRAWLSESSYAELIALANSLPGPASSQVGFAIGLLRAGWPGAVAAWFGFTLPSAILMTLFAAGVTQWHFAALERIEHGLQLVAVAVVAQAVLSMRQKLAPDLVRLLMASIACVTVLWLSTSWIPLFDILLAAFTGLVFLREKVKPDAEVSLPLPRYSPLPALAVFAVLLGISLLADHVSTQPMAIFAACYRAGAIVFGGGHVVLPLLERSVVVSGWLTQQSFLSGYGAVQAMPGPLFSFAAYLGAAIAPSRMFLRFTYASLALAGLFLPGLLAMAALLPVSHRLRGDLNFRAALLGVNAAVVGILAAAFVRPLLITSIHDVTDAVLAAAALALLSSRHVQPWMVVLGSILVGLFVR
jgi:chromate transporter